MAYNTNPLVYHSVRPAWISDRDMFWYRDQGPEGAQFVLYDAEHQAGQPAFDHGKLAAALSQASGRTFDAAHLPFNDIEFSPDLAAVMFNAAGRRWRCDRSGAKCEAEPAANRARSQIEAPSPDRKTAAFIRDNNLWVRDVASGRETQLTHDGAKDYGYATDNAGWEKSDRPILLWSPDSKKIATFRQDQRNVGEMYLVETAVGHPKLQAWKYPLPGDQNVSMIERVVISVDDARVVWLKEPPGQHRSTRCDHIICRPDAGWADVQWSPDSSHLAFVSTSRDHKKEALKVADAATGDVRDVLEEEVSTYYESGQAGINWRYLPESGEIIWFSERDDWGQLYLYDLATGRLKNQITRGEGNVTNILKVDPAKRQIYFVAVGKEKGRDPYFSQVYSVGFDGGGMTLLTPENATHDATMAPSGRYFADTYSTPEAPPVTVLRDSNGKTLQQVAKADITKLVAAGWKPPIPFTVKARDGATDLYGLMFRPASFEAGRKYPIVNHIYPGPQTGSVGGRTFAAARGDAQALAELGFIVIELDGMGTPWRSKKFHDAYFGDLGDNTLPDQVAGMKQLAERYRWIDLERTGIYGHSGGGYATADAMFRYPDFFKVGISESGNHDNREYEDDWGEKWQGLLQKNADGTTSYDNQANQNIARNLKGHLLLAHGTLDDNVPPYNTLLVVSALIKANKDFDLIMFPNRAHGYGPDTGYMTRRRWDYFVRHLLGTEPPQNYEMPPPAQPQGPP
ncbi:MAG: DPP IV N-terminal domain-containing protein, partial [Acidobacteria bacterium]|nr:DPP IV N-terminal domain-containing protein [Acidobacteriota bacterium]